MRKHIIVPIQLIAEDSREAYLARYHNQGLTDREVRTIIFREYGESCVCCGFSDDIDQLTLDHIKPVRGNHRKNYAQLIREGFPKDNLQVLCSTCNTAKSAGNRCPHEVIASHIAFYTSLILKVIVQERRA